MPGRIRALEANSPLITNSILNRDYKNRVQSHARIQEFLPGGGGGGGPGPTVRKQLFLFGPQHCDFPGGPDPLLPSGSAHERSGPEVIKLFSYSTQLSMKPIQLINVNNLICPKCQQSLAF